MRHMETYGTIYHSKAKEEKERLELRGKICKTGKLWGQM